MLQTITIQAIKQTKKDGNEFVAYKMNYKGKRVDLRFREESEKTSTIPLGISKIVVDKLSEAKKFFYPTFYATYKGQAKQSFDDEVIVNSEDQASVESKPMKEDPHTGEIIE